METLHFLSSLCDLERHGVCHTIVIGLFLPLSSYQEDSDGLSVVSSYCDVNGGRLGYEEPSLCILSPDCELYICEGDDGNSTDR